MPGVVSIVRAIIIEEWEHTAVDKLLTSFERLRMSLIQKVKPVQITLTCAAVIASRVDFGKIWSVRARSGPGVDAVRWAFASHSA